LEDGEIPSDEDDEPITRGTNDTVETIKSTLKPDPVKNKTFETKFNKNRKQSMQTANKQDRFLKYKGPSEDWAGDVAKAIKAAMEEDGGRNQEPKPKNKNNRNKTRKRIRDEKDEDRNKDQKVRNIKVRNIKVRNIKVYNIKFHLNIYLNMYIIYVIYFKLNLFC